MLLHPFEIDLLVLLRREADGLVAIRVRLHSGNRLLGQRLNLDEPLRRKPRLHDGLAAVAMAHVVYVVLHARQETLLFKILDNFLARSITVETRIGAAVRVDVRRDRP